MLSYMPQLMVVPYQPLPLSPTLQIITTPQHTFYPSGPTMITNIPENRSLPGRFCLSFPYIQLPPNSGKYIWKVVGNLSECLL